LEEWENHLDYQVMVHLDHYELDENHDLNFHMDDDNYHVDHLDMMIVVHQSVEMIVVLDLVM
jgi:hypothetical protein